MERYYNLQNLRTEVQNLNSTAILLCDAMENSEGYSTQKNFFDIVNFIFEKTEIIWQQYNNIISYCIEDDNYEKFIMLISETQTLAKILRYLLRNNDSEYSIDELSVICSTIKEKTNTLLTIIKDTRLLIFPEEITE